MAWIDGVNKSVLIFGTTKHFACSLMCWKYCPQYWTDKELYCINVVPSKLQTRTRLSPIVPVPCTQKTFEMKTISSVTIFQVYNKLSHQLTQKNFNYILRYVAKLMFCSYALINLRQVFWDNLYLCNVKYVLHEGDKFCVINPTAKKEFDNLLFSVFQTTRILFNTLTNAHPLKIYQHISCNKCNFLKSRPLFE